MSETALVPAANGSSAPMTPGMGVAGIVMCPLLKSPCLKSACELWVELTYTDEAAKTSRKVARCSLAWQALLATEQTSATDRLTKVITRAIAATTEPPILRP